jgi:hypothetical protein
MSGRTVSAAQFETEILEKSDPVNSIFVRVLNVSSSKSIDEMFVAVISLSKAQEAISILNGSGGLDELVIELAKVGHDKIQ